MWNHTFGAVHKLCRPDRPDGGWGGGLGVSPKDNLLNRPYLPNKILILGKVGFQSDQITAASWSGNTCPPSNQLIITLIRLLFATY